MVVSSPSPRATGGFRGIGRGGLGNVVGGVGVNGGAVVSTSSRYDVWQQFYRGFDSTSDNACAIVLQ